MKIRVVETKDFSPKVKLALDQYGTLDFYDLQENESLLSIFREYDVFWFRLKYQISADILRDPDLKMKYIVTPVTGLNHIDTDVCKEVGIEVISLKGEQEFLKEVRATAEHCLLLTLGLIRKLPQAVADVQQGLWRREQFKGREIQNSTIGIIGFGRLGRLVAQYYCAMGAHVLAYDISDEIGYPDDVSNVRLDDLLAASDIVSLHINYSKENEHFFNQNKIKKMKKTGVFINTSRGNLVDEEALISALRMGQIAGAALDVITNEYDLEKSPALQYVQHKEHLNLLITPHIGGNTYESFDKTENFVLSKLIEKINETA